jgi:hypothetical protein
MKQFTAFLAFSLGATLGLILGCQRYDFEPVSPMGLSQTTQSYTVVAKKLKPNVMLMVDESGSMTLPANTTHPKCPVGCGDNGNPRCPADCPTRISELRDAMKGFLGDAGTIARFGLTTFPKTGCAGVTCQCDPGTVRVQISSSNDVNSELQATADEINRTIQSDNVQGGTPTRDTILMLGNYPGFAANDRDKIIILETDGVPNCKGDDAGFCSSPGACTCADAPPDYCCGSLGSLGCLDKTGTANAIATLGLKNIQTFVIGFGDEAANSAPTLNSMAEAGGRPRLCPDGGSASCGLNNTCNAATGKCTREYFQANNALELAQVLNDIAKALEKPCEYALREVPSDSALLSVEINGQGVRAGPDTWKYDPAGPAGPTVFLLGPVCDQVKGASPGAPVQVDIRVVKTL